MPSSSKRLRLRAGHLKQWPRAVTEEAPIAIRRQLRRGWFALGLKLHRGSAERFVLGWEVRRSNREFALLGARSRLGMPAELLFKTHEDTLLFCTFVQQQNPIARAIWAPVEPVHLRIVPYLLNRAARSERRARE